MSKSAQHESTSAEGKAAPQAPEDAAANTVKPAVERDVEKTEAASIVTTALAKEVRGAIQAKPAASPKPGNQGAKEKPLPAPVKSALEGVRQTYQGFAVSGWTLAQALAKLKAECAKEGLDYLEVCAEHLHDLGADAISASAISKLAGAANYLNAKKIEVPHDTAAFPSVSQVYPLSRFLARSERAKEKKDDCAKLHKLVFASSPEKRPSTVEIAKKVAEILAPPAPPPGPKPYNPGDIDDGAMQKLKRSLDTIQTEGAAVWIANASKGKDDAVEAVKAALVDIGAKDDSRVCWTVWVKK